MKLNIWIITFILMISSVHALGMAPARSTIEFIPDTVQEGKFRIIVDDLPTKVTIKTEEELGKYIVLENNILLLEEKETWVNFKINLPKDLPPGDRKGSILVSEIPQTADDPNIVYAVPAIKHQVFTKVPYPGKYLTSKIFITNNDDSVFFTLALANWGQENIEDVKAIFTVKGPTNEEIAVIETKSISIESKKEEKFVTTWETDNPGSYVADVTVEYDGKILSLSEIFTVGNLEIEIDRIIVNNFKIGQIAKLDIYLRNKWNQALKVDGRVEVFKNNNMISSFNSIPVDILQKSTAVMNAYWNTEGIETGEYDILVKAQYNDKTTEKTFRSIVSIDNIQFDDFLAAEAIKTGTGNNTILLTAVFLLIIINIGLFIFVIKRLKK